MTRYVILGAGAVGATVAAELTTAGFEAVVVARGANLQALRERGLRYISPGSDRYIPVPAVGAPEELELRPEDVLVLATKSQDSEALLQQWSWRPVGGQSAAEALPIVLLQNGLENARTALRRFATVIDAVVLSPSSHVRPGEVVSPAAPLVGAFYLGLAPRGRSAVVDRVAQDFRAAHFGVQVVEDIARWKAGKLLGNLSYNLDAVYPPSPLRDTAAEALRAEAAHVLAVARIDAADVQAESEIDLSGLIIQDIPGHPRGGSSTWQSLARNGSVESDFLNGEIVLLARLHGVEAPVNAGVQQRIATASALGAAPATLDDADLEGLLAGNVVGAALR